ncbi:hypothetical protein PIROE2DRAFT_62287 [Piromyces sp. E2]|nr:hypothetical protein PIROE2DRAFT_62287 [Piromyces sp. E2]|eukprot:OUM61767.1 hypothetical protein PIROE2DRAFT_62287 [Piromyces sp. E2]
MKSFLFTSLIVLLCTIGIKGDEIKISHQETTFNINDFSESSKINAVKCESDNDCLSNSCVDGVCDFFFLCPENEKENCISLQSDAWKTYDITEDNDVHPEKYKPIIRSCYKEELHTNFLAKLLSPTCETEKCEKDNDCLFGSCYNSTCITETPIYKCRSKDLLCKKANFIKCSADNQCNSGHCISGFCLENEYPTIQKGVISSFLIAVAIRLGRTLFKYLYGDIKKKNAKSKPIKVEMKIEKTDKDKKED